MGKEVGKKQTKKRRQPFVTVQRSLSSFPALAALPSAATQQAGAQANSFSPPPFFLLANSGRYHGTGYARGIFRDLTADMGSLGAWVGFVWT